MPSSRTYPSGSITRPLTVLRKFRIIFNAVRTHFRHIEKQVGLGGAQVWALALIQDHPEIGMTGLAEHMDVHQSTASNLIKALLDKKLISLRKADDDRRNVCITILPAGDALLERVSGPFEGVLPGALAGLDLQTLAQLDQGLGQLIELLKAGEAGADIPLAEI